MISAPTLLTRLAETLKRTRADGVTACAHATTRRVFRFAHGAIHQDLFQERVGVTVRVLDRRRAGVASTERLDAEGLRRCARAAQEIARHAKPLETVPSLPAGPKVRATQEYAAATARLSAAACVARLRELFQICRGGGAELAGSLLTGEDAWAVVNSAGASCSSVSTVAAAKLVTMYRRLSGYASGVHRDVTRLDLEELLKRSLRQSLHRQDPVALPLGAYEVILEPEAVADLVDWLGYTAFGAKNLQERTSCLAGRLGEKLMHPSVTIADDGTDPRLLRLPFDLEGTPKRKVLLIDRGVAAGVVYDTTYGARFGRPSTGHAVALDDVEGPLPSHLTMAPGRVPAAELVRGCKRGLLIPRFHYVNGLLNPREALMTGLTREGTFLIEDGKPVAPVATLRFTQSILEAFRRVLGISKERRLVADPSSGGGCALMPAVRLAAFHFTGRSAE
jgi:predicted Zn-dependent protease